MSPASNVYDQRRPAGIAGTCSGKGHLRKNHITGDHTVGRIPFREALVELEADGTD